MLLSHKHKFIFIHCRKCAGSSIDAFLARHLGDEDLLIGSWVDACHNGASFNRRVYRDIASPYGIYCYLRTNKFQLWPNVDGINRTIKRIYSKPLSPNSTFPSAKCLQGWCGENWDDYFKFTFVRNSYSRAVSDWRWRTRKLSCKNRVSFTEFLMRVTDSSRPDPERVVPNPSSNWSLYTINDKVAVDFIGHVEKIATDFPLICSKIGIPFVPALLPRAKSAHSYCSYRKFYTKGDIDLAYEAYHKEIDYFGFEF